MPGDSFHWENRLALKIREDEELLILCKLFENFLEFYELDYTLNVFTHEVNDGDHTQTDNLRLLNSSQGWHQHFRKKPPFSFSAARET